MEAECSGVAVTLQALFVSGRGHLLFWGLAILLSPSGKRRHGTSTEALQLPINCFPVYY